MLDFELIDKPKESIDELLDDFKFFKNYKKIEYANVAAAFDIESSSFYNDYGDKVATMYAWVFGLNGRIIVGRTWDEFNDVIEKLIDNYSLHENRRLIIYVHNLSYEFQFIRARFKWDKVFALSEREVVYALYGGIEFRCSYILSGYSLAKLGEQCIKYPVKKMVGDLDYSKIRHCTTPLTPKEWKYIYNDALVVMSYIQQQIELEEYVYNIPLTATGYVRRYVKTLCLKNKANYEKNKYSKYMEVIKGLTIDGEEEYMLNKRAFIGGHSHGNPLAIGMLHKDVTSMDFTSSYPYVMLSEGYPMSKAHKMVIKSKEQFYEMIDNYCCIFNIKFIGLESITPFEHWIPSSKCYDKDGAIEDNGKIVRANELSMSLTEVDFKTISNFYKWDSMVIWGFRWYIKSYLPKNLILAILHLYKDKTELKGVSEKYIEYMRSKGNLNSCYGMMVTDICRDEITYNNDEGEWTKQHPDYEAAISKYNNSKSRVLYYTWGIYVTAYAKRNLASGILELGYDYLYADTDSVKFLHYKDHEDYFNKYNKECRDKLLRMVKLYKINPALIEPSTIEGKQKLIGVWDYDGHYKEFKYLGSKRYMYRLDNNKYAFTVAGCNKRLAIPYLASQVRLINKLNKIKNKPKISIMDLFNDGMYIPREYTCKNLHTYIDIKQDGEVIDYLGNKDEYHELSSVHLEPVDFTLSLSKQFLDYLLGIKTKKE